MQLQQRVALVGMLWVSSALAPASFAVASDTYEIANGSCPGSSAGVTVLAVLLVVSLAANGWFGYRNRDMAKQLQLQHVEQELGARRRQTVEMVANPLARRSSSRPQSAAGHIAGRAAAAIPPHEQPAYSEPTSDGVPTYQSAEGASY
eukprot:gene25494-21425_t